MIVRIATVLFCVLLVTGMKVNAQTAPRIIVEQKRAVAVSFVTERATDSWNVFRKNGRQPIVGKREIREDTLLFRPLIPFQPGMIYEIRNNGRIIHEFQAPEREMTNPVVVQIYPSSDSLPANLLKFYIKFSEPMMEGDPYPYLHLVNSENDTLGSVFLKQLPALWNEDQTMLSLWLDPGRIKRDLELNKRMGNPLEENEKRYRLLIDSSLKSRNGEPLQAGAQKKFKTVSADRSKPVTSTWRIEVPEQETTKSLVIHFNEAMDYLSTKDRLEVILNEEHVEGRSDFLLNENKWRFTPSEPWRPGSYLIKADARMEDLAGNNLNRLFDRDIKKEPLLEKKYHIIRFMIQ